MWQTDYIHILESQSAIVEWIRSTGLKPYLESLPAGQQPGFESEVLVALRNVYPLQKDGKVLFPFKRLFMIGYGTG